MTTDRLTGYDAIDRARTKGLTLNKYADPIEDAREGLSIEDARAVAAEDPELIYLDIEVSPVDLNTYAVVDARPGHTGRANVLAVHHSLLDAGDPKLIDRMSGIADACVSHHGTPWVYVDGPCKVGDVVEIDKDGCASVVD